MSNPWRISLVLACTLSASALHGQELPPRAVARLGDYRFHHGSGLHLVALSPDGSRVASLARKPSEVFGHIPDEVRNPFDRTIVVWDAISGQRLRELQAPGLPVESLAFTLDSKRLLVTCDRLFKGEKYAKRAILFFELDSAKIVDEFGPFERYVSFLRFSADGKQLLLCDGSDTVISFDLASRKPQRKWQAPAPKSEWIKEKERVNGGTPSPDGKFLAWHVYEEPDRNKLPVGLRGWIPDPTAIVVSDAVGDKILYRKDIGRYRLASFDFSPDNRWFMIGGEKSLTAWDTKTGKEIFSLADPATYTFWVATSPDGRWALAGDWPCRLWNLESKKPARDLLPGMVHAQDNTRRQLFSADGKTVALWTDSTLRVYDTATGKEHARVGHRAPHIMVRFSADGRTLHSACDETRCAWDLSSGKKPALTAQVQRKDWERSSGSQATAPCNDSRFFIKNVNDQVCICDTSTGHVLHELEKVGWHRYWIARFSPDTTRLALRRDLWEKTIDKDGKSAFKLSDKSPVLRLYDTRTGKQTGDIWLDDEMIWVLPVFSPDGRTIARLDRANDVHLHDAVTGKVVRTLRSNQLLPAKECKNGYLLFSLDGQHVIVTTHDVENDKWKSLPTRVFDVASGKEIRRFYGDPEKTRDAPWFSCAACSPDNRLLAVAEKESSTIRLIEIDSGKVRAEFKGHREGVHDLAFSADGKTLASGGMDNVVYLWDVIGPSTQPKGKIATETDLARWFTDLADNKRAAVAISALIREGDQTVKVLSAQLQSIKPLDDKRLAQLLGDLDAKRFAERQAASDELARFGDRIEDRLRAELEKKPTLEFKRRIELLLDKLDVSKLPPGTIHTLRVIEVLEHIGTPDAVLCLQRLATGAPEAWETRAAKSAVGRLAQRTSQ